MPEWNQSPGGGLRQSLDAVLETIRLKLEGFKGGPVLILVVVVAVMTIFWKPWFTVQPEETGIVQRFGKVMRTADADATRIYGKAYNQNPEFYAFLRTLESYKDKTNKNSVLILTTDSDFYQYIKQAMPGEARSSSVPVSRRTTP